MEDLVTKYFKKSQDFQSEVHEIFSKYENSNSRLISLDQSRKKLSSLSIKQNTLFSEALKCAELGLYKPACVMSWAAFMDFYQEKLASDNFQKLKSIMVKWSFKDIEELREKYPEFQILEVGPKVGLLSKNDLHVLKGNLTKRNNCAHPSDYYPNLNQTLGYISELMDYIEKIDKKNY